MPKFKCKCENIIDLSQIPSPPELLLISDVDFEKYWEKFDVEQLYNEMTIVVKCDNCGRLHIFFNGFDKAPNTFNEEKPLLDSQMKFSLYLTVLRFLPFKITANLRRVYLDVVIETNQMLLTAFYKNRPSELDLELLDDIVTNSNAHIPDFFVKSQFKLTEYIDDEITHDFVLFAIHE